MNFNDYYKIYLTYHKNPWTKVMHALGNLATVAFICFIATSDSFSLWWLLLSPFIIYFFAWPSHWWIEKNKPAAFKNPIKAKMADWKMMYDYTIGRML